MPVARLGCDGSKPTQSTPPMPQLPATSPYAPDPGAQFLAWPIQGALYTAREDAFLIANYTRLGAAACAQALGRSERSVWSHTRSLGLDRPRGWSTADLDVVRANYESVGPTACIALLSQPRTMKAVVMAARRMGLVGQGVEHLAGKTPKGVVKWTDAEDALLRAFAGRLVTREIHKRYFGEEGYNRTFAAVAQRCSTLGLTLNRQDAARSVLHRPRRASTR